jgi:predicted TIM-barrel fold metal-dependent hydrolase
LDNFFIVDFHAHPVETEANAQAMMAGNGQADCSGTVDELVSIMLAAGIDRAVLAVTAPTWAMYEEALSGPSQEVTGSREEAVIAKISGFIKNRNEWACQMAQQYDGLVPFVGLDPIMGPEAMLAELSDNVERRGAMGIKLHPGLGRYFPDDQRLWPVYEKATNSSIPILSHGGLFLADKEYTRPRNYNKVLREFPELTLIIAHLGRIYFKETLALAETYPNAYFDHLPPFQGINTAKN